MSEQNIIGKGTWIDKLASELLEREEKLGRNTDLIKVESGLGASGIPHIGSLRMFAYLSLVGVRTRHVCFMMSCVVLLALTINDYVMCTFHALMNLALTNQACMQVHTQDP